MDIKINKSKLEGNVKIPPSKSLSHRAIIAASLAKGKSTIYNISYTKDILATINVMENFGVSFLKEEDFLVVNSQEFMIKENYFNCIESGSTLRFTLPIVLSLGGEFIFDGYDSLKKRPISVFESVFLQDEILSKELGNNHLPLLIKGKLKSDTYFLDGNVSSQFISGMMFALSNMKEFPQSSIVLKTNLESKSYVDLTIDVLKDYGVEIINNNYENFKVIKKDYKPCDYTVEGDFSQVAFFGLAGIIGEKITVYDLNKDSIQGDKKIIEIIKAFGGRVEEIEKGYIFYNSKTKGIKVDVSEVPDLATVIFSIGAISEGETIVTGINRLRIKESDRVLSMVTELTKLGANITDCGEYVKIQGVKSLKGGVTVETWNDHRVAMALSILATYCEEEVIIKDVECIEKSFKSFLYILKKIKCQLSTVL